nr:battenin [Hymenolepis microstoma]
MLSAAVDILDKNHPKESSTDFKTHGHVNCTEMGTGAILLADIGPGLILKFVSPLFIRRLHFHLKVLLCALLALSGFLIVSFSKSIQSSLFGVVCASISCGLGDVTFLTMVAFFET